MPSFALDKLSALEVVARVENALMDGLPPPGQTSFGSHQGGVLRRAANELGTEANSVRGWVGTPSTRGRIERRFGIAVDWSLYGQAGKKVFVGISDDDAQAAFAAYRRHGTKYAAAGALGIGHHTLDRRLARAVELGLMPAATEEPPADPILVRRLRDENERLRAALKDSERRTATAEDLRAGVLGLLELPPAPIRFPPRELSNPAAETAVLFLSDLHWGEVVSLQAMDGLNSYNLDIARKRLARWTRGGRGAGFGVRARRNSIPCRNRSRLLVRAWPSDGLRGEIQSERNDGRAPNVSVRRAVACLFEWLRHRADQRSRAVRARADVGSCAWSGGGDRPHRPWRCAGADGAKSVTNAAPTSHPHSPHATHSLTSRPSGRPFAGRGHRQLPNVPRSLSIACCISAMTVGSSS